MRRNNLLFIFFLLYLSACNSIPYDETWHKWGEDQIEVRKALLECGAPSPFSSGYRASKDTHTYMYACMLVSGFRPKDESASLFLREYPIDLCNPPHSKRPSICDTLPSRNIERRLNSKYCKGESYRKETDPVPWECLP